jgi:hypothetical protein
VSTFTKLFRIVQQSDPSEESRTPRGATDSAHTTGDAPKGGGRGDKCMPRCAPAADEVVPNPAPPPLLAAIKLYEESAAANGENQITIGARLTPQMALSALTFNRFAVNAARGSTAMTNNYAAVTVRVH